MSYKSLKLGSSTESRESIDQSFKKIDGMLSELYTIPVDLTEYATKNFVDLQVSNLVDSAPSALNTLKELATALSSDANFSTTISTALGNRLRVDINNQTLDNTQQSNARTNLGLAVVANSGSYTDLSNKPTLFSGSYTDLSNKPTLTTSYNDLTNKPVLFSGSYDDLTNKPVFSSNQLINGIHTVTLDSDGILTAPNIISPIFTTTSASSIFQRPSVDTGLNIRSDVSTSPIFIYGFGTDGAGLDASEIDIRDNRVDIFANWGTALESKWTFKNIYDGAGAKADVLLTPHILIGSINSENQIAGMDDSHSTSIGNKDLGSYVRIFGSGQTQDSGIFIKSNTNAVGPGGVDFGADGKIEIDAGGTYSDTKSSIRMGTAVGISSQAWPPPGRYGSPAVVTTSNNMEIFGGTAFYGDVAVIGGNLGTFSMVFGDGTKQFSGYPGTAVPRFSCGVPDTKSGMIAFDANYIYYCFADYDPANSVQVRPASVNPGTVLTTLITTIPWGDSYGNIAPGWQALDQFLQLRTVVSISSSGEGMPGEPDSANKTMLTFDEAFYVDENWTDTNYYQIFDVFNPATVIWKRTAMGASW